MPDIEGHDCDAPVSVILHNVEKGSEVPSEIPPGEVGGGISVPIPHYGIPVVDNGVELHEWKDGPMSITRRAEVSFPLEALGEEWWEYIKAYRREGGWQKATILMTPSDATFPEIASDLDLPNEILGVTTLSELEDIGMMTGYIGAVGADGTNTGHLTIYGPYNLLGSIPVGGRINRTESIDGIFEFFASRFEEKQEAFSDIEYEINGLDVVENVFDAEADIERVALNGFKNFSANRDTLADVARFIREELGFTLRFEVQPDWNIKLVANLIQPEELFTENPIGRLRVSEGRNFEELISIVNGQLPARTTYNATSDGNLSLIENRALYEMKPYNTLIVKGSATPFITANDDDTVTVGNDGTYYEAKAKHPGLVERAGGEMPLIVESDVGQPRLLEQEARSLLKEKLSDASGGTMLFPLAPFIHPGDEIIAQPACNGMISSGLPDLTYEVERAIHQVTPNPEHNTGTNVPRTELSVTMATDPSDIVTSSTSKSLQPSEEGGADPVELPTAEKFVFGT